MTRQQMENIAQYFTGPYVAKHSIALSMPGSRAYNEAEAFFKARSALGINGYDDVGVAMGSLRTLCGEPADA